MTALVDTCGWMEWLTDGVLADAFESYMSNPSELVVPTVLHRLSFADAIIYASARHCDAPLITADDHFEGLPEVIFYSKRS